MITHTYPFCARLHEPIYEALLTIPEEDRSRYLVALEKRVESCEECQLPVLGPGFCNTCGWVDESWE